MADLLEGAARLELNLPLGVLHDHVGLAARLLADLLAQPLAVGATLRDDRVGVDARPRDDLRRLRVQPLEVLLGLLRIVERLADRVLPRLERLQERSPRDLLQRPQQAEERDDRPDEQPGV